MSCSEQGSKEKQWFQANENGFVSLESTANGVQLFKFDAHLFAYNSNGLYKLLKTKYRVWEVVVTPERVNSSTSFVVVGEYLYMCMDTNIYAIASGQEINVSNWVMYNSFEESGSPITVKPMCQINGYIYGVNVISDESFTIVRCHTEHEENIYWETLSQESFGNAKNLSVAFMLVYKDGIYVGTNTMLEEYFNNDSAYATTGVQVWFSSTESNGWKQINADGFGSIIVTTGLTLYVNQLIGSAIVYKDGLYVATNSKFGAEMWRYNGVSWRKIELETIDDMPSTRVPSMYLMKYDDEYSLMVLQQNTRSIIVEYNGLNWEKTINGPCCHIKCVQSSLDCSKVGCQDNNCCNYVDDKGIYLGNNIVIFKGKIFLATINTNTVGDKVWVLQDADNNKCNSGKECESHEIGCNSEAEGCGTKALGNCSHTEGCNTLAKGFSSHAEGGNTQATGCYSHAEGLITVVSGDMAHAEGYGTIASGNESHSEGLFTVASDSNAHAEGYLTQATGKGAHAEGWLTIASGYDSHAEGYSTLASGTYSHAEGLNTTASAEGSHAEGWGSQAINVHAHAEGHFTTASGFDSHTEGRMTIASGDYGSHAEGFEAIASGWASHAEGFGSNTSGKYAHSEGYFTTASGEHSHSEGNETLASGLSSHSEGVKTIASGESSHAEGITDILDAAKVTQAQGRGAHAEGEATIASGRASHSEGHGSLASGEFSHAEGEDTIASGKLAHVEGKASISSGYNSHAEGYFTEASGESSHAEGNSTIANSTSAHAEGWETTAGFRSHSEGEFTTAVGEASHAEGSRTVASGGGAHAEGFKSIASGNSAHSEGAYGTTASGEASHAEGIGTKASGMDAHAEGYFSIASGRNAHAEGEGTIASGRDSHSSGIGTIANQFAQTVIGKYNIVSTSSNDAFIIGNGSNNSRSNAFRLTFDGNAYTASNGGWYSGGADYAEMFEWLDGNTNDEDRVGYFVTIDGEKIRIANNTDEFILGIISSCPSVVGDAQGNQWKDMYLKDKWGRIQYEWVEVEEEEIERVESKEDEKVELKEVKKTIVKKLYLPKINPLYDPEKLYVPRTERQEWAIVGVAGKLLVRDDGTCEVNGYCMPNDEGVATKADTGFRVLKRIDEEQILIFK